MALIAQDMLNKEIAFRLGITEGTVKTYIHQIKDKLTALYPEIQTRTGIALFYAKHRHLLDGPLSTAD